MSPTPQSRIGLAILTAAQALVAAAALARSGPTIIETIAIHQEETETAVYLDASAAPAWRLGFGPGGLLELAMADAVPGPAVSDLSPAAGLVETARVRLDGTPASPRTVLVVRPRRPVTATVTAAEGGLVLRLRDSASPAPDPVDEAFSAENPPPIAAPPVAEALRAVEDPPPARPPAGPPAPAATPTPAPDDGRYRIGPGDVLQISVFGLDDLTRKVRVARDGGVSLPLLGNMRLEGLTPTEAEASVAQRLSTGQLVNDPQVTIFVEEYVSRGVSIQGAVNRPGVFQMIEQRTLLEMLGEAGGLSGKETDRAGQRIFVLRTAASGAQERYEIDAGRLIDEGDPSLNMALEPGDVVMVPHAKRLRVYVTGAIENPGHIEYLSSEGITVLQAITAAGGPTERSNLRRVHILRRATDGSQVRIPVNVKKIQKGRADDPLLESNDTVVVGEWFF